MNLRIASDNDYDAVMALMLQLNPDDPVVDESLGRSLFNTITETDGLSVYLAEVNDRPVATCYLNIMPNLTRGGRPYALIENVVTDSEHRRNGIGKFLLQEVMSVAFKSGCYKVMLLSGRDSQVQTFYEKCGMDMYGKTAFIKRND